MTHTEYFIGACVLIIAATMGVLQAISALGVICFCCKGKCLIAFSAMFYTPAHLLRPFESKLTDLSGMLGLW